MHSLLHFVCLALFSSLMLALFLSSGCAIHYFDAGTGAEHIWGIGHMAMKVTPLPERRQAVVHGTDLLGLSAAAGSENTHLSFGWDHRRRIEILDRETVIGLEWPSSDFFNVRIGSTLPHLPLASQGKEKKEEKE